MAAKQHGLMPLISTESNFLGAFDSANHKLLKRKLENIEAKGAALQWIKSYLHGRTAQVKIKNISSPFFYIPSGVSQGSHLGPLLFILFINDITSTIFNSELLIYADDAKMYKRIGTNADAVDLQRDIDALIEVECSKCP